MFWPRLRTQLGKGTPDPTGEAMQGSRDCNVRAFQHGFGYLTRDRAVPVVWLIRRKMGRSGFTPTNLWDSKQAAEKFDGWLARHGRRPIRLYLKFTKRSVRLAVEQERIVTLAVDYGSWNKLMSRTGDPNYTGGHAITVLGEKRWPDGTIVWNVYDSLEDNRRAEIPMGTTWRPRWKILQAAGAWAKKTQPGAEVVAAVYRGGGAL